MSQNDLLVKTPEDAARAENARRMLIAYLAGDQPDIEINEAVNTLCKLAPDILLDLRQRLVGEYEQAEAVCWEMSEYLDEYLSLGAEAATRMPLVHSHLASCSNCQDQLETLRAVVNEQRESWLAFSQSLILPRRPEIPVDEQHESRPAFSQSLGALVLTRRSGWQWRGTDRSRWRPVTEQDVRDERAVGAWRLAVVPAYAHSFKLHEDVKPPQSLSLELPENAALIRLHVVHDHVAHQDVWQVIVELDPGSAVESLIVGLGDDRAVTRGSFTLRADRKLTLQVEPPTQDVYWLHFSWTSDAVPNPAWREHKVELPLRFDPQQ